MADEAPATDEAPAAIEHLPDPQDLIQMWSLTRHGIMLSSADTGKIHAVNPAACRILGMTEAQVLSRGRDGILEHLPRRERAMWWATRSMREVSGEILNVPLRWIRPDGTEISLVVSSGEFVREDGTPMAAVVLIDLDLIDRQRSTAAGMLVHIAQEYESGPLAPS